MGQRTSVNPLGASTPVASGNPTQTAAAGADTQFKWQGQINHICIQNNSTINFNYAFDQDSTASGNAIYVLAPGAFIEWDRLCTSLHCSTASQVNFGGTSGITIEGFEL